MLKMLLSVGPIGNHSVCDRQTARRVGERERQTAAEDKSGPPVQAAH